LVSDLFFGYIRHWLELGGFEKTSMEIWIEVDRPFVHRNTQHKQTNGKNKFTRLILGSSTWDVCTVDYNWGSFCTATTYCYHCYHGSAANYSTNGVDIPSGVSDAICIN
jgi:hypothetical protein